MKRVKSTIKATGLAIFMLLPINASGQVADDMSAFMPSKAEMRKGLVDSGMTPAQIEQILNSMDFPEESSTDLATTSEPPCVDENENDICDIDESDPVITQCREVYQTELYATARGLYGNSLGRNAVEVAQTCSMAAVAGNMSRVSDDGGTVWSYDMDQIMGVASYWEAILSHGRYLSGSDVPAMDDLSDAQMDGLIASFPSDLKAMMTVAGTEELDTIAAPIHNKCERVRSRVGDNYSNNILVNKVCIRYVPDAEVASLEIK